MNDPTTTEGWLDVARERGEDASAMLGKRKGSVGPVYMAGYAVESALKAYLQAKGISRPNSGPLGHDIRGLWKASGLQLRDIKDPKGDATFFFQGWNTALRYQVTPPANSPGAEAVVGGATRIVGLLTRHIRGRA